MRTWTGILTATLAAGILLASCKKQDMDLNNAVAPAPPGKTGGARPVTPDIGTLINYKIITVNSDKNGMVAFMSGSINTILLKFDASTSVGSSLSMVSYQKPLTPTQQQLYSTIDLGYLNIPKATYQIMTFSVGLGGHTMALQSPTENALTLNGFYNSSEMSQIAPRAKTTAPIGQIPVRILVNNAVTLGGVYSPSLAINKPDGYSATLYFDPAIVVFGINRSMWENADRTNGEILISPTNNTDLYGMIVKNLATSFRVDFVYTYPDLSK